MKSCIATLALSILGALSPAAPAGAGAFSAWRVTDVAPGDTLNVRNYPASYSQRQSSYPNGKVLQMTGKCIGGVDLFPLAELPEWKQRQVVRYTWCQVWHDPLGNGLFTTGWVYGKYIPPL